MTTIRSASMIRSAVHQHRPTSREGMLERMFTFWFKGFVYNQIWEDPRVDAEALELGADSRILTISSGGCNVLNYLLHSPRSITAVDLNACHMSLTRLKLEAIRRLPDYDSFFQFFGSADHRQNIDNYKRYIRDHLDPQARRFWEGSWISRGLRRSRIRYFRRGLYEHSKMGHFIRFIHRCAKVHKIDPNRMLRAATLEEQQRVYQVDIDPFFDKRIIRQIGKIPWLVYSLGIPPQQYRFMMEQSNGEIVELFRERVRRLSCQFPLDDNYFCWQAYGRKYDLAGKQALPDYLKPENYDTLRANVERVETHITSLHHYLSQQPAQSLDRFVFLDSQDWMKPAALEALWGEISRVGRPGSRIIFRTASAESPIEHNISSELRQNFVYEKERSQELYDKDRSAIYGGFHLYVMPG